MSHMAIYQDQDARELVTSYLTSREWWTIVAHNKLSADVMEHVEKSYYAGVANADFHLSILCMMPMMALGFAHKRRMNHKQLETALQHFQAMQSQEIAFYTYRDIIVPIKKSDTAKGIAVLAYLGYWIGGNTYEHPSP